MRGVIIATVCFGLSACGSEQYRQERSICAQQWYAKIPVDQKVRVIDDYVTVEKPTGKTECTTDGNRQTCVAEMKEVRELRQYLEEYDANEPQRDRQIRACTIQACRTKYGSDKCDVR